MNNNKVQQLIQELFKNSNQQEAELPGRGLMPAGQQLGNCTNCITTRASSKSSNWQLYRSQGLIFEAVEHSGRYVHAPEQINRLFLLMGGSLTARKSSGEKK